MTRNVLQITTDGSSFELGAVNNQWRPVAYALRAITHTEDRYVQVEKEALAITWGSERFLQYLLGLPFEIKTNHKPLVSPLGDKPIDELLLRIQRFRMKMMEDFPDFTYKIFHVLGKNLW